MSINKYAKGFLLLMASAPYLSADCRLDYDMQVKCGGSSNAHYESESGESGFFIGIHAGVAYASANWGEASYPLQAAVRVPLANISPNDGWGFAIGGNVGYKLSLHQNYGFNYYIDYNYMQGSNKRNAQLTTPVSTNTTTDMLLKSQMITANADFYAQFDNGFGFFFGVGLGYHGVSPRLKVSSTAANFTEDGGYRSSFTLPINVGLTYNFSTSHQISLLAKIPTLEYEYNLVRLQSPVRGRAYIINVGYNFLF